MCDMETHKVGDPAQIMRQQSGLQHRHSMFLEVGLRGQDAMVDEKLHDLRVSLVEDLFSSDDDDMNNVSPGSTLRRSSPSSSQSLVTVLQSVLIVVAIAVASALILDGPSTRSFTSLVVGAEPVDVDVPLHRLPRDVHRRADDATNVCTRWAHMSAVVNNTLYIYGGQATENPGQTQNTWNNNFLSLDLSRTWQIASPSLTSLPQPSGPPAVALGVLWNSLDSLYLYGGEFSWQPVTTPAPFSLWSYSIASKSWTEHANPKDSDGQPVERAAEGAGVSAPSLGRGFYLGGHLDGYTTSGWSQSTPRLYLESTLEYTMPGHTNAALSAVPGSNGAYRNISANSAGFPQRADGVLVYVPGWGKSGIIVGIAGGTNDTFTQMNVIDVYDIADSKWYKQATSGPTPKIRVNPCAVAMTAADGSSTQIYMYGGQNLQPAGEQVQYDDVWILTLPSFTWIEVDQTGQSTPPARAGHSCNAWDGQMVVVGGYVGQELSCDSPGIYIFNTSALSWQNQFTSLQTDDPLNRQNAQKQEPNALQGSYGYAVPALVQSQIGGNAIGSATATAPVQIPTQGPLVSGGPKTYTATGDGGIPTQTASPGMTHGGGAGGNDGSKARAGAIAAGVIAGILAALAAYLGFCTWIYRRQLQVYKQHVAMVRQDRLSYLSQDSRTPFFLGATGRQYSDKDQYSGSGSGDRRSSPSARTGTGGGGGGGAGNGSVAAALETLSTTNNNGSSPYRRLATTANDSTDDLLQGQEPTFVGVMLHPRRSLRVVNRD